MNKNVGSESRYDFRWRENFCDGVFLPWLGLLCIHVATPGIDDILAVDINTNGSANFQGSLPWASCCCKRPRTDSKVGSQQPWISAMMLVNFFNSGAWMKSLKKEGKEICKWRIRLTWSVGGIPSFDFYGVFWISGDGVGLDWSSS